MPTKDKLKSLLSQRERKVPDAVRLKEMNQVRNYNRNQFQKVFDAEKRQVEAEKESIKPASAKDVGSAFKLQVYILKLNQILQLKQETFQSLTTSLEGVVDIDPAVVQAAQQGDQAALRQVAAAQAKKITSLRGTRGTEATLATSFFSKAELLAAFNEMMAFIKLFMPDLTGDNRQMEQIYSAYLTPLTDLLKQVQGLYPKFFESIPAPRAPARGIGTEERQTYELMRQQSMYMYALMGTMAEFLDDENLRPLVAQDVSLYIKENNVRQIFTSNPLAGNVRSAEVQLNLDAQQAANQRAAAQAAAQQAAQQARQDALEQQLQEQEQAGLATTAEQRAQEQMLQAAAADQAAAQAAIAGNQGFNARNPNARIMQAMGFRGSPQPLRPPAAVAEYVQQSTENGVPDNLVFVERLRQPKLADKIRYVGNNDFSQTQITNAVREFRRANPQYKAIRGPPRQPPAQPGQAGPAQQNIADIARADNYDSNDRVQAQMGINRQDPRFAPIDSIISVIKGYERDTKGAAAKANSQADVNAIFNIIDQRHRPDLDRVAQSDDDKRALIADVIRGMRDARSAYAQQQGFPSGNEQGAVQNQLFGMGLPELKAFVDKKGMFPSKMNPKHVAHFMKLNIPPEAVFKLMKKHGIRDGALMEEMEGSGIFDDLKDLGKSAFRGARDAFTSIKDSAGDAFSSLKNVLPSMSDVRRGIDKVVPDQYKKHLPDSLQTTMFDKAKNLFGFGESEAGGRATRHREPFSAPNLDKYGYRQGAAQRMRIMPVDKELVSGLHNLIGGDQLRDTDPEVLRRRDHIDIDVPPSQQQPIHGYGVDGDEDDQFEGGLKQRLRGMPISMFAPRGGQKTGFIPMFSGAELDPYADRFEGGAESFYEEEEKPHDHDEDPTPFRVRDENYKVNTGKLKKVTYKI